MGYKVRWVDKTGKREKLCSDITSYKYAIRLIKSIMSHMQEGNKIIITKK